MYFAEISFSVRWVITIGVLRPMSDMMGLSESLSSSAIAETKDSRDSREIDKEYSAVKTGRYLDCGFVVGGLC